MKYHLYTACLAGLLLTGFSSAPNAETLDEAVAYALSDHPSIFAAQARRDASAETISEERAAYYPTASATATFGRVFSDNTTTRGLSTERGTGYSWYGEGRLSLNQKLYDWSATGNRVDSAKSRYESSNFLLKDREHAIAFQTTQAYVQLVRAQSLKKMADSHLKSMMDYKNRISAAVENGGADESELSRAQDLVSLAENAIAQGEADLNIAMAGFVEAVGRMPEGDLSEPSFDLTTLPPLIDDAITQAKHNHPQIAAAMQDANAAFYDGEAESGSLLPTLDAELSYSKKDQKDLVGGESEDARALLKMNWDMNLGGGELAAQRRLAQQEKEAIFIMQELTRTIERDVKVAWASLKLSQKQKSNESERLNATKQTLKTYSEQYEGGQKTVLDLMTAEAQVFAAGQAYTNLLYREMDAAFALKSLIGHEG